MKSKICSITAQEIIDSRGTPTVEAVVTLCSGVKGIASVPSGASTGIFEAIELRDNGNRYFGKGVLKAVENVKELSPKIVAYGSTSVREIDKLLIDFDGTDNKSNLGANATLAISLALAKANANEQNLPLYRYIGGIFATKLPLILILQELKRSAFCQRENF